MLSYAEARAQNAVQACAIAVRSGLCALALDETASVETALAVLPRLVKGTCTYTLNITIDRVGVAIN